MGLLYILLFVDLKTLNIIPIYREQEIHYLNLSNYDNISLPIHINEPYMIEQSMYKYRTTRYHITYKILCSGLIKDGVTTLLVVSNLSEIASKYYNLRSKKRRTRASLGQNDMRRLFARIMIIIKK